MLLYVDHVLRARGVVLTDWLQRDSRVVANAAPFSALCLRAERRPWRRRQETLALRGRIKRKSQKLAYGLSAKNNLKLYYDSEDDEVGTSAQLCAPTSTAAARSFPG